MLRFLLHPYLAQILLLCAQIHLPFMLVFLSPFDFFCPLKVAKVVAVNNFWYILLQFTYTITVIQSLYLFHTGHQRPFVGRRNDVICEFISLRLLIIWPTQNHPTQNNNSSFNSQIFDLYSPLLYSKCEPITCYISDFLTRNKSNF